MTLSQFDPGSTLIRPQKPQTSLFYGSMNGPGLKILYEIRETKKQKKKKKKGEIGFLGTSMRAHTQGLCMQLRCMHTHTRAKNPNPETSRTQNRVGTKTIKSNNLTYLRVEKQCKHNLNKHIITKKNK